MRWNRPRPPPPYEEMLRAVAALAPEAFALLTRLAVAWGIGPHRARGVIEGARLPNAPTHLPSEFGRKSALIVDLAGAAVADGEPSNETLEAIRRVMRALLWPVETLDPIVDRARRDAATDYGTNSTKSPF